MDKVRGGTPRSKPSLCKTCRHAFNVQGMNLQEVTMCRAVENTYRVTFPVTECSDFEDKCTPTKYEMEQIAWKVESRQRGPMGFTDGADRLEVVISPPKKRSPFGIGDDD